MTAGVVVGVVAVAAVLASGAAVGVEGPAAEAAPMAVARHVPSS